MQKNTDSALAAFTGIQSRVFELAQYTDEISRHIQQRPTQRTHRQALPPIWHTACHVHCGKYQAIMNQRPLLFKLFKAFIDAPDNVLGRQQLLATIYPGATLDCVSKRLLETHAHNLVKLLGRGRELGERVLSGNSEVRWFVYDLRSGNWSLRETRHTER